MSMSRRMRRAQMSGPPSSWGVVRGDDAAHVCDARGVVRCGAPVDDRVDLLDPPANGDGPDLAICATCLARGLELFRYVRGDGRIVMALRRMPELETANAGGDT